MFMKVSTSFLLLRVHWSATDHDFNSLRHLSPLINILNYNLLLAHRILTLDFLM